MKRLTVIFALLLIAMTACCQADQTFIKPIYANGGIYFLDGSFLNSSLGTGVADWNTMINKPATFPPSAHNHDLLYKPFNYVPTWAEITGKPSTFPPSAHTTAWADITGKPTEIELIDELALLPYTPLVQKTTAEINALVIPTGTVAMVWDKTLGVLKIWNGSIWKTIITNQ